MITITYNNKIGETVIFNKDLHTTYYANLINDLKVYNPSLKQMDSCEHWGWNAEGENNYPYYDFGKISDFHFEISKTETRLYYGDSPELGYFKNNPSELVILPVAAHTPKFFHHTNSFKFEKKYPNPDTMWSLAMFIDNFLYCRLKYLQKLKLDYSQNMLASAEIDNSDLPF